MNIREKLAVQHHYKKQKHDTRKEVYDLFGEYLPENGREPPLHRSYGRLYRREKKGLIHASSIGDDICVQNNRDIIPDFALFLKAYRSISTCVDTHLKMVENWLESGFFASNMTQRL